MGAEVGVLELQIHDNSAKAASGLGNLASALTRVQKALGNGLKLGNTANQIEKLVTKMQTAIPEESISRLERLAKAVETLNRAGGINLSGIKGLSKEIRENVSEIKSAAEGAVSIKSGTQNDFAERFEEAKKFAQDTVEAAERIDAPLVAAGRSIGVAADNAERLRDAMAEIHSYARLGSGSTPMRLGPGGGSPLLLGPGGVPNENALSTWVDFSQQWQTGWTTGSNDPRPWFDGFAPLWTMEEGFDEASAGVYRFATAMDEAIKKTTQFMALASGQHVPLLGAGNAGMELSTWVDQSRQWSPNWTYGRQPRLGDGSQNWVWGDGKVSEASETIAGVEEVKNSVQETIEKVEEVKNSLQDTGAATAGLEGIKASVQETNQALEDNIELLNEQRQARKAAMEAENQARLERNYPQFRELFMSGERPWTTQVPEMYGFTPEIIKQSETYAEAVERSEKAFAAAAENSERVKSAMESVASALRIGGGQSFTLLGSGGVPDETAMSTLVDYSEQWKQNWTNGSNFTPNWTYGKNYPPNSIFGEGTVTDAAETANAMESVSEAARTAGSSVQELNGAVKGNSNVSVACTSRLGDLDKELKQKKKDAGGATSAFQQLKDGIQNLTAPITGFIGQLARVAKYRMLRAIIKQISEGFMEGVENYYHYSEAINNGFSAAMDSAATSLQTFKNSIGAAVAPIIQALIPVLQQAVTWFVSLINYVNQFIALLSGKTSWSMAVDTTAKAFEDTKKKAGGATKAIKDTEKAVKDLLADFDELNIIQSETGDNGWSGGGGGGGGSGKTATDYTKMFQENFAFNNDLLSFVNNLKDKFADVRKTVATIGAALLGWAFSKSFSGLLGTLGGIIAGGSIIKLTFDVVSALDNTFFDTGHDEWLLMDVLATMIGAGLAEKVVTMAGGKALGQYAVPLTLLFSAAATIKAIIENKDLTALDARTIKAALVGALKAGAAVGLLAKNALGMSTFDAVLTGVAGALIVFGVTVGLKAILDTIDSGEVTEETIKAGLLAALTTGTGLGIAYHEAFGYPFLKSLALGAGSALIMFGALVGLMTTIEVLNKGEVTPETIEKDVIAALTTGTGLALVEGALGLSAGQAAATGIAGALVTFGVLVGLQTTIEVANSGEITQATIERDIIAALTTGTGFAIEGGVLGLSAGQAIATGVAGAFVTFGVLIGLQATAEVAKKGEITKETLEKDIIAALTTGTGFAIEGGVLGLSAGQAVATGVAGALATFGVLIGLQATAEVAKKGEITKETLEKDIIAALTTGTGLAIEGGVLGLSAGQAVATGIAGALVTFGVLVGLQATAEVAKKGEFTEETLRKDVIAALTTGTGLAVAGGMLGLPLAGAAAVGAVGALMTFGVLCTVQAVLTADKEEPIKWGEEKFTQEEIEAFVGELFTVEPSVTVSLLKSKVEISEKSKEDLRTAVGNTLEKLEVLKVGLDDENSLKELEDAVFNNEDSLMNKFKKFAEDQRTLVATTLKFAIINDENGNNEAETIATEIENGWTDLEKEMNTLGGKLSEAFKQAYDESMNGEVSTATKETIAKLTQMMADISAAVSYGQSKAKAMTGFTEMAKGMSQETASQVIEYYRQMKDEMIAAEMQALQETAESALALSYAYQYLADKAETEEERLSYQTKSDSFKARYGQLIENAESSAAEYVNTELQKDENVKTVRDSLLGNITEEGWDRTRLAVVENSIMWNSLVSDLFTPDGQVVENAKDTLQGSFVTILQKAWGDKNANTFVDAVESGLMSWSDLIKPEVIQALEDMMDLDQESGEIKQAWADLIKEVLGEGYENGVTLPEAEVEQQIELETEVTEATPEIVEEPQSDVFDIGSLDMSGFDAEFIKYQAFGNYEDWRTWFGLLFPNGRELATDASSTIQELMQELISAAFDAGTANEIFEAIEEGTADYGDIFTDELISAMEEALGIDKATPEIRAAWESLIHGIFDDPVNANPEVNVDPNLTGKTNGTQWGVRVEQTARRATGYYGDAGVWAGSQKLNDTWDKTTDAESVQAGVQGGTAQMQTDLQNGMANRKIDIQNGVQAGTGSLLTALNNILATAQAISRKEFTVNLVPSAGFGRFIGQSSDEYSRVTGDV